MDLKIIYEDENLLVVDKPAGIVVFPEGNVKNNTLIDLLIEQNPNLKDAGEVPRYGVIHRLDKDTSGILLVAKSNEALIFFQKQFKNRRVEKKYTALATGTIKEDSGNIKTLIGRSPSDPRKQKVYSLEESKQGLREAISKYKVLERFSAEDGSASGGEKYTLLEVSIETGRKHQIRCHLAHIHHPITGDKVYGFKDSPVPEGLTRQFLHASYLKVELPNQTEKEFISNLPDELKEILNKLR